MSHRCASVLFCNTVSSVLIWISATQTRGGNKFLAAKKSDNTVPIIGTPPRANSKCFLGKQHAEELEPALGFSVKRYNINLGSMEPWCYKSVSDHQKGEHATKHELRVNAHSDKKE